MYKKFTIIYIILALFLTSCKISNNSKINDDTDSIIANTDDGINIETTQNENKENEIVKNNNFDLETISTDKEIIKYPKDDWIYVDFEIPGVILTLFNKIQNTTNIVMTKGEIDDSLEQYIDYLLEYMQNQSKSNEYFKVLDSEYRTINNKKVYYYEIIDFSTEPMALRQITMVFKNNDNLYSLTGTHLEDSSKEITLKCMETIVENFEENKNLNTNQENMEEIDLNFNLETVNIKYGKAKYPKDDWDYLPVKEPLQFTLERPNASVNLGIAKNAFKNLEDWADALMEREKSFDLGITYKVKEIRNLGNREIYYIECTRKTTEDSLDYLIASGMITEEMIEESGGREALLSRPEINQITIMTRKNNKSVAITGSYKYKSQKEIVLKCMKTLIQTLEIE